MTKTRKSAASNSELPSTESSNFIDNLKAFILSGIVVVTISIALPKEILEFPAPDTASCAGMAIDEPWKLNPSELKPASPL